MSDDKKSPGSKFRDYRGTRGQIDDADNPSPKEVKAAVNTLRRSNAVTVEQAMRTERKAEADEGTRAFGPPLSTPAPSAELDAKKANQSTDDSQ